MRSTSGLCCNLQSKWPEARHESVSRCSVHFPSRGVELLDLRLHQCSLCNANHCYSIFDRELARQRRIAQTDGSELISFTTPTPQTRMGRELGVKVTYNCEYCKLCVCSQHIPAGYALNRLLAKNLDWRIYASTLHVRLHLFVCRATI